MKTIIFQAMLTVAFVLVAGYNVYHATIQDSTSDLVLANVEALAFDVEDLDSNCTWEYYQTCYYLVVSPDGNTVWSHSNFRNR